VLPMGCPVCVVVIVCTRYGAGASGSSVLRCCKAAVTSQLGLDERV
jgi:hypothetical protein